MRDIAPPRKTEESPAEDVLKQARGNNGKDSAKIISTKANQANDSKKTKRKILSRRNTAIL